MSLRLLAFQMHFTRRVILSVLVYYYYYYNIGHRTIDLRGFFCVGTIGSQFGIITTMSVSQLSIPFVDRYGKAQSEICEALVIQTTSVKCQPTV